MITEYIVYVLADEKHRITSVDSSAFVSEDWGIEIDRGAGDKYHHAQGNYFLGGIYTADGIPRYKLVDGQAVERSAEEIAADRPDPLEAAKAARIQQSKDDLEAYLEDHPLTWTDGKQYNITREKQQQLTSKILSATLAHQTSTPYELTWNATGAECTPRTLEELASLAFAIDARVTALVKYQQAKEVAMQAAATLEELEGVSVDYDEVS